MNRLLQRNLQPSLISPYFLVFHLIFHLVSTSFLILFIHLFLGLSLPRLPSIFVWNIFLRILSSAIRITCPNQLNLLFWTSFLFHPTLVPTLYWYLSVPLFRSTLISRFHFNGLNVAILSLFRFVLHTVYYLKVYC